MSPRATGAAAALAACLLLSGCAAASAGEVAEQPRFERVGDVPASPPAEPDDAGGIAADEQPASDETQAAQPEAWPEGPAGGYDESLNNNPAYINGGRGYGNRFESDGVASIGGTEFNWYSQNAPGYEGGGLDELNANGRHVDGETGFVVDGDGYIAVASPWGWDEIGTVVETPFGPGKVYDANEGDAYDIYTDF